MSRKPAIGIGVAVFVAALCLAAFASDSSRTEKTPAAVDAERYADFIENEVLDVQDLAEGAEIQRRFFNRITPPGLSWAQPMFPSVTPFDATNFDDSFLDGLMGEDRNSVAVYPLSLALDPKTRETLVYNADGKLVATLPAEKFSRSWPEEADPARVTLQLDLLPAEDVEPYLYAESRIAEYAAAESKKPAGMALRSLGGSEFGFTGIRRTNGAMRITATNGMDGAEIYSYTVLYTSSTVVATWTNDENEVVTDTNVVWTPISPPYNGIESGWECRTTNLLFTNGAAVWEDSSIPSNALVRFYAAAKPADTDEDGLTDGAEIFLHRTDPGLADTDGDGMPDGWEVKYGLNARSGLDPSLACWWKLDDGEGTNALNSAADAHHGELRGFSGATNGGWTAEGMFGGALAFDGSDDWVRIAQDAAVLTGGPFTVSAWARLDGSCTSDWPEVVSDLMAGTYDGYCLGFGPDDKAYAMIGFSGWAQDTNALADQWVWLALEFDGTDMRLYRNGELVQAPVPASHAPATNGFFSIGNGQDTAFSEHWKGLIDDVRIYRSAIGTNGLAAMYDTWEDPDGDGLLNIEESRHLANPHNADSDGDGLDDNEEVYVYGTDPIRDDTDGDGMPDGWEIGNGFNPNDGSDGSQDADGDGLTNAQEYLAGTDPFMADSDGDGITDDIDSTPASSHCTLGKELYYYLPPYFRQMDNGNTGYPVYAGTVYANPTGFVGNMVAITNITLIGAVDDCFKINGHEYAWRMTAKYFTTNITAAVSDLQAGTFAVDIYDYITNTPNNQVALLFDFGYSLGARCIYQYDIDLAVNFPLPQDWVCWSPNGTYDARARLSTDSYTDGRVYWSITNVAGPAASIYSGGLVAYGAGGGRYRIKATSVDATNCFATMTLVVTKVDIEQTATNVCKDCGCSVTLNVTPNSYSPGGYVWSSSPAGISGSGPSITFNPSNLLPGAYTVYAKSAAHPECFDTCTVNVLKVDLDIWNGGADLDNGEAAGSQGAQVPDDDEESVGAYLLVNWDDDDGDGEINSAGSGWTSLPVPDLDESTTITDEDNLAQLKPNLEPILDTGTVELEVSGADAGKIKLWTSSSKGTEVTLTSNKKTWDLSNSTQKSEFQNFMANSLWIEGIDEGSGERAVTFTLRYKDSGGTEICNDVNKATVVMLNLANAVGREVDNDALAERGHTSIVGRYDGTCTKADLVNAAQYTLYEADGGGDWAGTEPGPREALLTHVTARPGREFFGSLSPFLTSYYNSSSMPNTVAGYRTRLKILLVARRLIDNTASIGYTKFNAVLPGSWNGNLGTITDTRCDGFVEVCYEWSGVSSWGRIVGGGAQYSILVAGNQDDHNEWAWGDDPQDGASDFWAWLMPITQIGYADTYVDSHYPPYTSGDFDYTANNFEGTFWESAFSSQQLVKPTLSTP